MIAWLYQLRNWVVYRCLIFGDAGGQVSEFDSSFSNIYPSWWDSFSGQWKARADGTVRYSDGAQFLSKVQFQKNCSKLRTHWSKLSRPSQFQRMTHTQVKASNWLIISLLDLGKTWRKCTLILGFREIDILIENSESKKPLLRLCRE